MSGRSISGRVNLLKQTANNNKRSRETAAPDLTAARLKSARAYKKHKQSRGLTAESMSEAAASSSRLVEFATTAKRNRMNQSQPRSVMKVGVDEERFFSEIDGPLSKTCGGCGERVSPTTTRSYKYDRNASIFQLLAVTTSDGVWSDGLVEAGVVDNGSTKQVTFCQRCVRALDRHEAPIYTAASGFRLSAVPPCLAQLNPLEARMLGIGVCFTTCYSLGGLGQSATRGNSINFWNEAYDVVLKLPRPSTRCGVIRMSAPGYRRSSAYYHVRPWFLRQALVWLKAHNPIYKVIVIDDDLLAGMPTDADVLEIAMEAEDMVQQKHVEDSSDDGSEAEENFAESFVMSHEVTNEREDDKIANVLNGNQQEQAYTIPRNDRPMNEYSTKLLMQSCFPTLFPTGVGGFHPIDEYEDRKHQFKLADYCAHLMSWHDRRFITHPTFKFFCMNLIQRRQVDGLLKQIKVAPATSPDEPEDRGGAVGTSSYCADTTSKTKQYLRDLKPFFRAVRGTGLYWANVRDDLMSMIGNPALPNKWPTFFVTLSAADTVWPDFFRACDPSLSFEEAADLSPSKKRRLLNANPDIAAHHFHRRFQAFFKHILCGKTRPLGDIIDFFWRVEFQRRGSPHIHALLWVKDAPDIIELSKTVAGRQSLSAYADKFVSCLLKKPAQLPCPCKPAKDPLCVRPPSDKTSREREADLSAVVERVQQHICSARSSCQRNGTCRFDFPKELHDVTQVIREEKGGSVHIRFEHKRDHEATNNYNPEMLSAWRANMDVKIIGNAFGAAEYTAAYVSKAEPDSVRFYNTIAQALQTLPNGVPRERALKRTATTLLAMREVSAQEAVYILSNTLCLYGKSRSVLTLSRTRPYIRNRPNTNFKYKLRQTCKIYTFECYQVPRLILFRLSFSEGRCTKRRFHLSTTTRRGRTCKIYTFGRAISPLLIGYKSCWAIIGRVQTMNKR